MLYLVATPIGNLEDLTLRALRVLREVNLIAAEDTRHSRKLLSHYEIETPMVSFHAHSKSSKVEELVQRLQKGESLALISDAGTPGISDPAWPLVQACLTADVPIVPIPGASAFLTALMGAGLPMHQFSYLGFVPAKKGRQTLFESLREAPQTTALYESPHRLLKTLSQMQDALGPDRIVVMARELTKLHESFHRGRLEDVLTHFKAHPPKGELVILVSPSGFVWEGL